MKKFVIYANGSKILRRVVFSNDPEYDFSIHLGPGESMLEIPTDVQGLPALTSKVEQATGIKPKSPRCAVIDQNGDVVGITCADPELDNIPDKILVSSEDAKVGWKWDGTKFINTDLPNLPLDQATRK